MEYQPVYDRLVQAARAKELVHYVELAKMLGIDMDDPYFGAASARCSAASARTRSLPAGR